MKNIIILFIVYLFVGCSDCPVYQIINVVDEQHYLYPTLLGSWVSIDSSNFEIEFKNDSTYMTNSGGFCWGTWYTETLGTSGTLFLNMYKPGISIIHTAYYNKIRGRLYISIIYPGYKDGFYNVELIKKEI
jgi:hypothetical protein